MSEKSLDYRRKNPTGFENGKLILKPVTTRKRRNETFMVAQEIHGGSQNSSVPGAIGLVDTALSKCSPNVLVDVMSSIYRKNLNTYESSNENMIRSISIYYSGAIAGKQKYRKIYKNSL